MTAVSLRRATPADVERIVAIVYGEPSAEAAALAGGEAAARAFGRVLADAWPAASWPSSVVAEADGRVVGVLQHGDASEEFRPGPRFLLRVIGAIGPLTAMRSLPRGLALQRVRLAAPAGSWVVHEVHVEAEWRGRGIGAQLMAHAEDEARRQKYRLMALTTRTNNPARRLYERLGFTVESSRTDSAYERYTGAAGRVLMTKPLA